MPKQKYFLLFLWLYLRFAWISSGEIFQNFHSTSHPAGFKSQTWKKLGLYRRFFRLLQIYVLPLRKNWSSKFPWKRAPTKVKYLLPVCQILQNFTEGKARKFTVSFAFCAHVDVIEIISKNTRVFLQGHPDYLSFRPQHTFNRKTIGSHLKLQCCTLWLGTCLQM